MDAPTWKPNPILTTVACLCLLPVMMGCGKDYGVELFQVNGTVTLDGRPLENASVEFRPDKNGAVVAPRGGIGFTDQSGKYVILFRDTRGCPEGTFRVVVSTHSPTEGENQPGQKQLVPKRYRGQNSELSATVTPEGDNVFNFELSSK